MSKQHPYMQTAKLESRRDRAIRLLSSPAAMFLVFGAAIVISAIYKGRL